MGIATDDAVAITELDMLREFREKEWRTGNSELRR